MKFEGSYNFLKKTAKAASFAIPVLMQSAETQAETGENISTGSERMEIDIARERTFITMPDGVLFLDKEGRPIATVGVQMIDGINPGKGFVEGGSGVTEGYSLAWREAAREYANLEHPDLPEIAGSRYNWVELQNALTNGEESMSIEDINSIIDIVYHFADKDVIKGGGLSRIEYLQQNLNFNDSIPETIRDRLVFFTPGIAAVESRFNDDVTSPVNASGIFQFMPETVAGLGYEEFVIYKNDRPYELKPIPFTIQVDMVEKHFENILNELHKHIDVSTTEKIRWLFGSEEDFQKMFWTPIMINSYQTGSARMADAVNQFVASDRLWELYNIYDGNAGYDIFHEVTQFAEQSDDGLLARYGTSSSAYFEQVAAYARLILERYMANQL